MDRNQYRAFSLVELLVVLALLGIFASVAVPSFKTFVQRNQDDSLQEMLSAHINHARAQAIINNRTHNLCGSSDGKTCNGDWSHYWVVTTASDEKVVQSHVIPENQKICWNGFSGSIAFRPNGTSPKGNGRFALCREQASAWQLVLNRQGRLRKGDALDKISCC